MMIMLPRTRLEAAYTVSDATHLTRVALEHENVYLAIARGDGPCSRGDAAANPALHLSQLPRTASIRTRREPGHGHQRAVLGSKPGCTDCM